MKRYIKSAKKYATGGFHGKQYKVLSGEYSLQAISWMTNKKQLFRGNFSLIQINPEWEIEKWKFLDEENDRYSIDKFDTPREAYNALIHNLTRVWYKPIENTFKITTFNDLVEEEV